MVDLSACGGFIRLLPVFAGTADLSASGAPAEWKLVRPWRN